MELRRGVLQAIADPTRQVIITLVAVHAMTPGAIAEKSGSSRQTIFRNIQILTKCKLLGQEQKGREIYYHVSPQQIKEISEDFIEHLFNR